MASSLALSPLGFFGSWRGDTEDRKGAPAVKYRIGYANFHFGLFGQVGGYAEGNAVKEVIQGDDAGLTDAMPAQRLPLRLIVRCRLVSVALASPPANAGLIGPIRCLNL